MTELPKSVRNRLAVTANSGAGVHPEADLLAGFSEHSLGEGERLRVFAHLAQCERCREIVALALPSLVPAPAPVPVRRGWFAVPLLFRWGAGVAALVVISAALWLQRPEARWLTAGRHDAKVDSSSAPAGAPAVPPATEAPPTVPAPPPAASHEGRTTAKRAARPETDQGEAPAGEPSYKANSEAAKSRVGSDRAFGTTAVPLPPASPMAPPSGGFASGENVAAQNAGAAKYAGTQPSRADTMARQRTNQPAAMAALARGEGTGVAAFFWSISSEGKLQRSSDQLNWQTVEVAPGVWFRSVARIGPHVWAGGTGGALFHSPDGGSSWQRVPVGSSRPPLAGTITGLNFTSPSAGTITTSQGEQWSTRDGGRSWSQSPAN